MPNLEDVLLRGDRASQPIATDVAEGTLYYVTDEALTEQQRGGSWVDYSDAGSGGITELTGDVTAGPGTGSEIATLAAEFKIRTINLSLDGGGAAITTGIKGYLPIPFDCTIIEATLLADQTGDMVIDIWNDTYANFPPTDADSITASAPPTLNTEDKSQDSILTGWSPNLTAGDVLGFNVDSNDVIERVTLQLVVVLT
jgi:hypothetical protein